jgi:hypothetical protein
MNDDDIHVEISEQDMNNPELAKELAFLEGNEMTDENLEDLLNGLGTDGNQKNKQKINKTIYK